MEVGSKCHGAQTWTGIERTLGSAPCPEIGPLQATCLSVPPSHCVPLNNRCGRCLPAPWGCTAQPSLPPCLSATTSPTPSHAASSRSMTAHPSTLSWEARLPTLRAETPVCGLCFHNTLCGGLSLYLACFNETVCLPICLPHRDVSTRLRAGGKSHVPVST